jgi:hypothetical protein
MHLLATSAENDDQLWRRAPAGIWHHVFDSSNKIKEIWFLRQLSHDELESKVRKQPAPLCVGWSS